MTWKEMFQIYKVLMIVFKSIAMVFLSFVFLISAIVNQNLEHLAIAMVLNVLSSYEMDNFNKKKLS